ncbi:MAG TPA: glycosyltransferase family 2 protein [Longimicrobiales bacterium]|jgi:GT2 family glycosyltransferase
MSAGPTFDALSLDDVASLPDTDPRVTTISVVIPVGPEAPGLRSCLESLLEVMPAPLEIVVVLDGSSEANAATVRDAGLDPVTLERSLGPAGARNAGARRARGDLLFFLDADVTVPPDIVSGVLRVFEDDRGLTALIGSYDDQPGDPAFLSQYRNLLHHFVHQNSPPEGFTFWGACGVIRREAFLEAGGFDETYVRPSVEDIELGYRLRRAGHRIRLVHGLQVKHWKRWGSLDLLRTDVACRGVPWTRLILRHRRLDAGLNLAPGHRLSAALGFGLVLAVALSFTAPAASLWAAGVMAVALTGLNVPFYRFLKERRGPSFALRAIPLHWVFHACAGVAAVAGILSHVLPGVRVLSAPASVVDYS